MLAPLNLYDTEHAVVSTSANNNGNVNVLREAPEHLQERKNLNFFMLLSTFNF